MSTSGVPDPDEQFPPDGDLFERAPCGLLVCSPNGSILRANATFCRYLGYSEVQLKGGKRLIDLLSIGGRLFYQTHCSPLLSIQGSIAEVQMEMLSSTREKVPVLINMIRRQIGNTTYDECAVTVTHDRRSYERELLRERKNAESALDALRDAEAKLRSAHDQLSEAHARKDEFLATLAHELRNPLAPMRNILEIVRLDPATDYLRAFDVLDRQTKQLTHLVEDLMDVSRITAGRLELRLAKCDLTMIARAAADDIGSLAHAASHMLNVDLPPYALTVDGDETRLAQIIINLLTNAVKYTPEGGCIGLSVQRHEGSARIVISDNGIGIPGDALHSVFNMFSQLVPALERAQGGLGIGLSLVRGLVELHGGSISAHSDGPGLGSVFAVTLPLPSTAEMALPSNVVVDAVQSACRNILVVDDNVDSADTLAMALELLGNRVVVAYSGAAGLQAAAQKCPDVILLDIGLPDLNGYEVARRIRAESWGKEIILIAATGWGQEADRTLAFDAGFNHHLVKPIGLERLRDVLSQL